MMNAFTGFLVSIGAYVLPTNFSSRPLSPRTGSLNTGEMRTKFQRRVTIKGDESRANGGFQRREGGAVEASHGRSGTSFFLRFVMRA